MYYRQFPLRIIFLLCVNYKPLPGLLMLGCLRADALTLLSLPQAMPTTSAALNAMNMMPQWVFPAPPSSGAPGIPVQLLGRHPHLDVS